MGVYLNKAIGYGVSYEDFMLHSRLKDSDIYSELSKVKGEVEAPRKDAINNNLPSWFNGSRFSIGNILNENNTLHDLLVYVSMDYDNTSHILFHPDCSTIKKWHRTNDDIDSVESTYQNGFSRRDMGTVEPVIEMLPYGMYPYSNNIMKTNGEHVQWSSYEQYFDKEKEIIPEPPCQLLYWLRRWNVLSEEGCLKLRPYYAKWWS